MEDEQPDSLEGWVPLREGLFARPERRRLRFLVAWNAAQRQFAVTCQDGAAGRARGWAGLLSAAGLRGAHGQLAALRPGLERLFPELPPEPAPRGVGGALWALVWPARAAGPGEAALLELCAGLERYLGAAAEACGGDTVRDALFPGWAAADDSESPRAFRTRRLRARKAEAGARLRQVRGALAGRGGVVPRVGRGPGLGKPPGRRAGNAKQNRNHPSAGNNADDRGANPGPPGEIQREGFREDDVAFRLCVFNVHQGLIRWKPHGKAL